MSYTSMAEAARQLETAWHVRKGRLINSGAGDGTTAHGPSEPSI
jgi:hypothetical protein